MKTFFLKKTFLLFIFLVSFGQSIAQDCNTFYSFKENTGFTIQNFDAKNKMSGSVKHKFLTVTQSGNVTTANVEAENFDAKGKSFAKSNYTLKCDNGVIHLNMNTNMVGMESSAQNPSAQTSIEGGTLELPSKMEAGQTLNNATYRMKVTMNGGIVLVNKEFVVKDRKVEGIENVTTPAGTFEAYKISYTTDFEGMMGKKRSMKSITWFAKGAGMVKSETYDEENKLMAYSVLSEISK